MSNPLISFYAIIKNEEELVGYMMDCVARIADALDVCAIIDNGSTDATLDIVYSYKDKVPLVVKRRTDTEHHGQLRNAALEMCKAPYVFFLDGDETFTADFRDWLFSKEYERADQFDFYKWTTIVDCYHTVRGGNGPTYRMFKNLPGVSYVQSVHTEASAPGMRNGRLLAKGPQLFDATACKSVEALWAKGWRYSWANRLGVVGVGPIHEYTGRVENAHRLGLVERMPEDVISKVFTGPGFVVK